MKAALVLVFFAYITDSMASNAHIELFDEHLQQCQTVARTSILSSIITVGARKKAKFNVH